jgi:hypothetical protein
MALPGIISLKHRVLWDRTTMALNMKIIHLPITAIVWNLDAPS